MPFWYVIYIQYTQLYAKGIAGSLGEQSFKITLTFYLIVQGFDRTYATGAACQQRTLTPPDTWSCPTLGLACVLMSRPTSPELVLSPDVWISNTPRYFSFAFLITMNYVQKYDMFFPFFIQVVIKKSKAYSFLIFGMTLLQKILLSVIMLRFHFFTTMQGTWVHKYDRGPLPSG